MQKWAVLLLVSGLLLAGCGGAAQTPTALPTSTTIPTYEYVEPTAAPSIATAAAATAAAASAGSALDAAAVERGRGRYEALSCGECHGANGEGTDNGSAMSVYAGTEEEFIAFMRSGGELGADHQYSTNRLSDSGGRNLYQYLLSLRQSP
jgi:mono/diheme cytochrome c family protein